MGVERLVAAFPYAGTARARGVVDRWDRVVLVVVVGGGRVLVVVVVAPLVVVALVVVGMVLRVWP